jgi:hypothetical protein
VADQAALTAVLLQVLVPPLLLVVVVPAAAAVPAAAPQVWARAPQASTRPSWRLVVC